MSFRKKFILVVIVFGLLTVAWISMDFKSQEVPFVSVSDLVNNNEMFRQDRFRLGGNVQEGTIHYSDDKLTVDFLLEQGDSIIPVEHTSAAIPDLFKDGAQVIVEGSYKDGIFYADNLMTKCASRYEEESKYTSVSETN